MIKYLSWVLTFLTLCGALTFAACYFHRPEVLLGLAALVFLPQPFRGEEGGEEEGE